MPSRCTQLVDRVGADVTPDLKAKCRRAAKREGVTLAAFVRGALVARLATVRAERHGGARKGAT